MSAVIKRVFVVSIVGLCAASLSLHFAVESLGGVQDHFIGEQAQGMSDAHEGDQFVAGEAGNGDPARTWISLLFISKLKTVSRPLTPLFPPPKSI
jgi:hypothetical protein